MDELTRPGSGTGRDRDERERLEDLPAHEDDSDVAGAMGGGVLDAGGTAIDRGTGELSGTAQGPDAGAGTEPDPTPGILDFTEHRTEHDDGAAGERPVAREATRD